MSWQTVKLGDFCVFSYGKSLPEQKRLSGEICVFGSNGLVGTHNDFFTNGQTIIIGRKGSIGRINWSINSCWPIDTTYYIDQNNTQQNLRWLFWLLSNIGLNTMNKSVAVPGLNREDAYRILVKLPPLPEQKRIAAILDKADEIKRKREAAISKLDQLAQSIFVEMFGDPKSNSKKFKKQKLTEFFKFKTGKLDSNAAISDGEYPFFTCSRENFWIDKYAFDEEALLLAGNNANADYSVKYYKGKFNAYQRTYILNINDGNSYSYAKSCLEFMLKQFKHESKGISTKFLTMGIFDRMLIQVPPLTLQEKFADRINKLEKCKADSIQALAKQNHLFASLQHQAFAGQL